MQKAIVVQESANEKITDSWGSLTWYASGKLGNSNAMTIGKALIKPGCENPLHSHPNCSEVLVVVQGRIAHVIENGNEVEMTVGDTITLPRGLPHKACNIGEEDAILSISFDSADRQTKLE